MITKSVKTIWAKIYISGPVELVESICREYCSVVGLCVTVTKTKFIYTGGEEDGVEVGLINYPKFPLKNGEVEIRQKANKLAMVLLDKTFQDSVLVMTPTKTEWHTKRIRG